MHRKWPDFASLVAGLALCAPALAQSAEALSGDYVCTYGCRLTDAPPSIAVDGDRATCTNEYGGLFHGRLLTGRSLSCFNKIGRLLEDGKTIQWEDRVIWRRLPRPALKAE